MIKRDWKKIWFLGILTAGVYNWYIVYCMHSDITKMEEDANKNTMNSVLFLLLSFCTGSLFAFVESYVYYKKALALAETYKIKLSLKSPLIYAFIVMYVPVLSYMIPIKDHNKLIDAYESKYGFRA